MTNADAWRWWTGPSEEGFDRGPFNTREEAVKAGSAEVDEGGGLWVVEARRTPLAFSAKRLIDDQYFDNENYFDFEHDDVDRLGDHAEADAELQALIDAWTQKWTATFVAPTMFAAQRNLEFIAGDGGPA